MPVLDQEGRRVTGEVLGCVKTRAWVEQGVKLLIFRKNLHLAVVKIKYKTVKGSLSYFISQVKEYTPETVCFTQPPSLQGGHSRRKHLVLPPGASQGEASERSQ